MGNAFNILNVELPENIDKLNRAILIRAYKVIKARFRLKPRKSLGQHFVVSPRVIKDMVSLVPEKSRVLEIGSGMGFLTKYLGKKARHVIGVEIDERLALITRLLTKGDPNVDIFVADALSMPWNKYDVIASNVPYSITSPFLVKMTREGVPRAFLTLQREVAYRLSSKPGTDEYGRLTILVQCFYNVKIVSVYPPHAFYPEPEVYSALVEFIKKERPCIDKADSLERVTEILFRHRNKTLRWVLAKYFGDKGVNAIKEAGISLDVRVRALSIDDVVKITRALEGLY